MASLMLISGAELPGGFAASYISEILQQVLAFTRHDGLGVKLDAFDRVSAGGVRP